MCRKSVPIQKDQLNQSKKDTSSGKKSKRKTARGKGRTKATAEQEAQAKELLALYGAIKPPGYDTSRTRAKKNILKLLKANATYEELERAVRNYGQWADAMQPNPQYLFHSGNFFGRDALYKDFSAEDWQMPEDVKPSSSTTELEKYSEAWWALQESNSQETFDKPHKIGKYAEVLP